MHLSATEQELLDRVLKFASGDEKKIDAGLALFLKGIRDPGRLVCLKNRLKGCAQKILRENKEEKTT